MKIQVFGLFDYREIGSNVFKNEQNIGTVIFEKSNFGNHCWTSEELTILNSRRMFQDLMPKVFYK